MPIMTDVKLTEVNINLNFIFMVEIECYGLVMNPIYQIYLNGDIIDDNNKRALPVRIFNRIKFNNGEKYKIKECRISSQDNYIIMV